MSHAQMYCLRVEGILDPRWAQSFQDLTIAYVAEPRAETIFTGLVPDPPALHGILNRIRDLNLDLIAVQRVEEALTQTCVGDDYIVETLEV